MVEVLRALGKYPCSATEPFEGLVTTIYMVGSGGRAPPSILQHDWQPGFQREEVLDCVARDLAQSLRLEEIDRRGSVHFRDVTVVWADGARWSVIMDEGFGFLEPSSRCQFDFRADPKAQGHALLRADFSVRRRSSGQTLFLLGSVEEAP